MRSTSKVERPFLPQQANFLAGLAEEAEAHFNGPDQVEWFEKLECEYDNLEAVLNWLQEKAFTQSGPQRLPLLKLLLRLAGALWRFWQVRGYLTEGRTRLEGIISSCKQAGVVQFAALRAKVLHGAGVLTSMQGDFNQVVPLFEESLKLRRRVGDQAGITACLNNLGILALYRADYEQATAYLSESLTLRRQQGDKWGICNTLTNLGNVKLGQGNYLAARSFLEESLTYGRELGDKRSVAICLYNLGNIALLDKRVEQALSYYKESLAIRQELGDKVGLAECLEGLAGIAEVSGQANKAARLYGAAAHLRQVIGAPLEPVDQPNYNQFKEQTRQKLGQNTFEENWTLGSNLSQKEAFEYALAS